MRLIRLPVKPPAVATHGGAGGWSRERAAEALKAVEEAAVKGYEKLLELRDVLDAVAYAVKHLEDSGVLNAGRGSVLTVNGMLEMDAGVASSDGLIGAVAAVRRLANPVLAALIVARETPHILLAGEGADKLGEVFGVGLHPGPPPERAAAHFERMLKDRNMVLRRLWASKTRMLLGCDTVGAVASMEGKYAAATSTGGVAFKLEGRVGDTPIYGAGFYADENVACSATGIGETIVKGMVCLRIADALRDLGDIEAAIEKVLSMHEETFPEAPLGVIVATRSGLYAAVASKASMPVGYAASGTRGSILLSE